MDSDENISHTFIAILSTVFFLNSITMPCGVCPVMFRATKNNIRQQKEQHSELQRGPQL